MEKKHWWKKVWALMRSTLFCCCINSNDGDTLSNKKRLGAGEPEEMSKNQVAAFLSDGGGEINQTNKTSTDGNKLDAEECIIAENAIQEEEKEEVY